MYTVYKVPTQALGKHRCDAYESFPVTHLAFIKSEFIIFS